MSDGGALRTQQGIEGGALPFKRAERRDGAALASHEMRPTKCAPEGMGGAAGRPVGRVGRPVGRVGRPVGRVGRVGRVGGTNSPGSHPGYSAKRERALAAGSGQRSGRTSGQERTEERTHKRTGADGERPRHPSARPILRARQHGFSNNPRPLVFGLARRCLACLEGVMILFLSSRI